jgi:hypothetical protein
LKGKVAEAIVEEMFLNMGYEVYKFGMEHTIPGIMKKLRGSQGQVAKEIRRMPDLVLQDKLSNEAIFLEIKFRADGKFEYQDLKEEYPYADALVIVVSKCNIKCLSVAELKNGKSISPNCQNLLSDRSEFSFDYYLLEKYCGLVAAYFNQF